MTEPIRYVNAEACCRLLELREAGGLSYPALAVGLALASFVDGRTGEAVADLSSIGRRAGVCRSSVSDVLGGLEKAGFLTIDRQDGKPNTYRLTHPKSRTGSTDDPSEKSDGTHPNSRTTPVRKVGRIYETREQENKSEPVVIPSDIEALAFSVLGGASPATLTEWLSLYPADWIRAAFSRLESSGKVRNRVAYCRGILQGFQRDGGPEQKPVAQQPKTATRKPFVMERFTA